MEGIKLIATEKSPGVHLDPEGKTFEIEGNSRPENVREFYEPILNKLKEFFNEITLEDGQEDTEDQPVRFDFKLEYFNSSSAKFISDILLIAGSFSKRGVNVKIYWYFDEGDKDMMEVGEDFSDMIDLPFHMIMVKR